MSLWDSENCLCELGRRNDVLLSQAAFSFMVAHSGWMSEHLSLQSLLRREVHCTGLVTGDQEACLDQTQEITEANACSSQCPAMPFPSVAWPVSGPVSLVGRGLMLLFHRAGY